MKKIVTLFIIISLSLNYTYIFSQGYEIKIIIPQLKNQKIMLLHYFSKPTMHVVDDSTMLNKDGVGILKGKTKLPEGMYFFYLPNYRFDILISNNQNFTIENDTIDFIEHLKVTGDKENQIFSDYQRFHAKNLKQISALTDEYKVTKDETKKKELEKKYIELNTLINKHIYEIIKSNPDFFFTRFLYAIQEIKVPDTIVNQEYKYFYYRNQYFKQFDFKDARLLRTPIYEEKLNFYIDKILPQVPDSLIQHVDYLIENSRHNKELFRYMLVSLFNKFATSQIMGMENVYIHIAEKYYIPEAYWADKKFIDELKEKVRRKKQALIGMQAPEIKMILLPKGKDAIEDIRSALEEMKTAGNTVLKDEAKLKEKAKIHKASNPKLTDSAAYAQVIISDLAEKLETIFLPKFDGYISMQEHKSKYLILYFWEPDCSHCKEATPKFSAAYNEKNLKAIGVDVMAVYLHKNINEWEKYTKHIGEWLDFMEKNNMQKWINVWEPFGYSQFRDKYDISSSPVLYLLDKDKKILAKNIGWEQAFEYIEHLEKIQKVN